MWNKIYFNASQVERETDRAVLINMPNKSGYKGFSFWHPKKLVRDEGGKGYHLSFSFTESFSFNLTKKGTGKYNSRDIIDERSLTHSEMEMAFNPEDESISSSVKKEIESDEETYLIIEEPNAINVKNVKVEECLQNK